MNKKEQAAMDALARGSTEALALKALRHTIECKAARDLADIDERIAKATTKAGDGEQGGTSNG